MGKWVTPGVPVPVVSWFQQGDSGESRDYDSVLRTGDAVPWDPWLGRRIGDPISRRCYEVIVDFLRQEGARRRRIGGLRSRDVLDFTVQPTTRWLLAWLPPRDLGKLAAGQYGDQWVDEGESVGAGVVPPRYFRVYLYTWKPREFAVAVEVGNPDTFEPGTPEILVPGEGGLEWPHPERLWELWRP